MSAVLTLHSSPICPACRSILMTAAYLDLKLDVKDYDLRKFENRTEDFRKMNPMRTVPTIDDNGFYLWESRAILGYLVNKYAPGNAIYPHDARKRAEVDKMLYFDIGKLYPAVADIGLPLMLKKVKAGPDKYEAYHKVLKLLEEILSKTPYAAGSHITIADFAIVATLNSPRVIGLNFDEYPIINAYINRLKSEIPQYEQINDVVIKEYKEKYMQHLEDTVKAANFARL